MKRGSIKNIVKKIEIETEIENDAEVFGEIEKRNVLLPNISKGCFWKYEIEDTSYETISLLVAQNSNFKRLRLYPKNLGG
ncbi:hypothetical protein [Aequorivita vladivostokensis]|uniref:Uncharacterized protein n=1 Tax=Aequorivita vladivostokensis TaxID=171194 RepID=A0ABR5DFV7_9FLAO|nr:hypothetical protein [Aequorivita vladivostokensis]KJJ37678.1 hypothetical protein MB09_13035 [Aequorivita vladivostokensis]